MFCSFLLRSLFCGCDAEPKLTSECSYHTLNSVNSFSAFALCEKKSGNMILIFFQKIIRSNLLLRAGKGNFIYFFFIYHQENEIGNILESYWWQTVASFLRLF